eukprot:118882-Prorocentrum_lima.AAC.1
MTSSLVGSEMCIRDRMGGEQEEQDPTLLRPGLAQTSASEGYYPLRARSCLLYTSDAADDM